MKPYSLIVGGIIFVPFGILAAWWSVRSLALGEFLTSVVTLGVTLFSFGIIAAGGKSAAGRVTPRTSCDGHGTKILPDFFIDVSMLVGSVGILVASTVFVVFAPMGRLDIPIPHTARLSLPFMAGATIVLGVPTLWPMLRRGSSNYLLLTLTGFEMAEGFRPQTGTWDAITNISDAIPDQRKKLPNKLVIENTDGSFNVLSAGWLTPGGKDLREWVRFYWKHPDYRDELTDGRAAKRLADRQFKSA